MKKTDPYKLLRIISLILGIICMLLMLKGKVLAAGIDSNDWNYINEYFVEANNYNDADDYLEWIRDNHTNFIIWEDSEMVFIITYAFDNFGILFNVQHDQVLSVNDLLTVDNSASKLSQDYVSNGCLSSHSYTECPNINVGSWSGDECVASFIHYNKTTKVLSLEYLAQYYVGSTTCDIYEYNGSDGFNTPYSLYVYGGSGYNRKIRHITGGQILFGYNTIYPQSFTHTFEHVGASGSVLVPYKGYQTSTVSGFDNYMLVDTDIYHYNDIIDTPRFNIYIELENNEQYLIFDYSDALLDASGMNWYDPYNNYNATIMLFFDLVLDGETYEFEFDNDQVQYFVYGSGNTVKPQYFKIPFSTLLNGEDISLYNEAYVENVIVMWSYNIDATDTDYDFYHTSQFTLFNQINNSAASAPGEDVPPIITSPITQNEWDHIVHDLNGGFVDGDTTSEFNTWLSSLRPGTSYYLVQFAQGNKTWAEFLNDYIDVFVPDLLVDVCEYFNGITNKDEFIESMEQYIVNNAVGSMVDYLIFGYYGTDTGSSDNFIWFTYNTTEGRLHGLQFILNDNTEVIDKQYKLCQEFFKYYNDRLTNIDTNIYNLTTENFSQNNTIISALNSLVNKIKDLDTDLSGWLKKILDALQSLDIEIPDADYSSIISAINGVKTAIEDQDSGNIDTDSYQGYKSWLFDIDRNDAVISPHEFAIDSLNTVKGFFDWATTRYYPSAAAEFFQRARDYVTFLNGTNDQYHNYSTGIVNGNYDPHNINGTQYP